MYFDVTQIFFIEYEFIFIEKIYILISHKYYFCNISLTILVISTRRTLKTAHKNKFSRFLVS